MLNGISNNTLSNLEILGTYNPLNFQASSSVQGVQSPQDVAGNVLDSEAQEALAAVGNDLNVNMDQAQSIHQGLNYSRVMSLLEGL